MMGWIANILCLYCWWAYPRRRAILVGALGSLVWAYVGYDLCMWDLVTIEVCLASLQFRAAMNFSEQEIYNAHDRR